VPHSIRNLKIRQQILLVTIPPLFALLASVALFFYAYWTAIETGRDARKSAQTIVGTESILRHLAEMEMGVRGYLLTGESSFLAFYQVGASLIPQTLLSMKELESGNPRHLEAVAGIEAEFKDWEREWAGPAIEEVRRNGNADSATLLARGKGRTIVLREQLQRLRDEDNSENLADLRRLQTTMQRMLYVGVGVAVLLAGVLLLLTRAVTHLIAEPVAMLIDASERVSCGDFRLSLPAELDNEFGVLSGRFSRMTTALRQEQEEMQALNQFAEKVAQCTSEREVYDHLLPSLRERFHPGQIIIFKLNPSETYLEAAATLHPLPEKLRGWPVIDQAQLCKAVRTGRAFRVNDISAEPPCPSHFALPAEGSYYCGPLIAGGIIIGSVRLEGMKDYWTPERASLLENYLSVAATALSNIRLLDTMKQQANVDPLTGLYNRRFLEDFVRRVVPMARRKGEPFGVILLDIDHFKTFNDIYGHESGDRILRQFSKTVTGAMRESNIAARIGGEEFVVVLPETDAQGCLVVAERIRKAVSRMVFPTGDDKPSPDVTVSGGIAVFPEQGTSLEELLQAADKALYESKRGGRNRVMLYVERTEAAGP
jgi:diguanylate cyclase (GGDEF)-like protein